MTAGMIGKLDALVATVIWACPQPVVRCWTCPGSHGVRLSRFLDAQSARIDRAVETVNKLTQRTGG